MQEKGEDPEMQLLQLQRKGNIQGENFPYVSIEKTETFPFTKIPKRTTSGIKTFQCFQQKTQNIANT